MKNAVVLLTVRPNPSQVDFFRQIERENLDLFVLADDNGLDKSTYAGLRLIQIDDVFCREAGFRRVEHVSAATLAERYFSGRTDGLRPPNNAEELIVCRT